MKTLLLALSLSLSSLAAQAGALHGTVQVGPYFNCVVYNHSGLNLVVTGTQYEYTCMNPFNGARYTYRPYYACNYNCALPAYATNQYSGPSTYNCNVIWSSCAVTTIP